MSILNWTPVAELNWIPVAENAREPPRCLEARDHDGARFEIRPHHHRNNTIDGWSLTFTRETDSEAEDLGTFADAVSAPLHAQQHDDRHRHD